jgi:phytanoyl-CoA hydroxylase
MTQKKACGLIVGNATYVFQPMKKEISMVHHLLSTLLTIILLPCYLSGLSFLTEAQVAQYERDGYLVIPNFVSQESCDGLKAHVEQLLADFDPESIRSVFDTEDRSFLNKDRYFLESGDKIRFFFETGAIDSDGTLLKPKELAVNKIGHAMHDIDPVFNRFSRTERLAAITDDLGVHDPLLVQSMYIFKQPYIGGEVNCHQDSTFMHSTPNTTIGYWIAIEDATLQNGCLWAIPGGHCTPLKELYVWQKDEGAHFIYFDTTPWDLTQMVPLEVKKGTLIVLHGLVPHMSYANKSNISRHAYTLHVIDASSIYPEDNWLRRSSDLPFRGF